MLIRGQLHPRWWSWQWLYPVLYPREQHLRKTINKGIQLFFTPLSIMGKSCSTYNVINQSVIGGWSGQYHTKCLLFPSTLSLHPIQGGPIWELGQFFSNFTECEIEPMTTGPAGTWARHCATVLADTRARHCTTGLPAMGARLCTSSFPKEGMQTKNVQLKLECQPNGTHTTAVL